MRKRTALTPAAILESIRSVVVDAKAQDGVKVTAEVFNWKKRTAT
jgi:hypothetical protein